MPETLRGRSGATVAEVMRRCAEEAGALLVSRFRRPQAVTVKGRGNPVTQTDLDAEERILQILGEEFPGYPVLAEETRPAVVLGEWLWIVDPLDGTRNYLSGIPFFCVNLALARAGRVEMALTFDPLHGEAFFARRGRGATCNGQPIHVSQALTAQESVIGFDLGYWEERGRKLLSLMTDLWPGMQGLRLSGSAALSLAYVAAGRLDLYLHHYLYPWDFAAGSLLIPEAGGVITDRAGGLVTLETQSFIAGGPAAHADILALVREVPWE